MKTWDILSAFYSSDSKSQRDELLNILLKNRGIIDQKAIDEFLTPKLRNVTVESVGIDKGDFQKAIQRIRNAIEKKEHVVVFGDYDVDGICGTAILWETLHTLGAVVTPYIPHRVDEGYGLSTAGIENVKAQIPKCKLIITVDNGIVAHEAVAFAKQAGIDVIITDHHVSSEEKPSAYAIVHTTKLCGTGVAYLFSLELFDNKIHRDNRSDHLGLVALATIADLVPLLGANRTLTKFGLKELRKTSRVGLSELFKEAGIQKSHIDTYVVGHIIAPRLNAMGRMEYAMESLRLLCTNDRNRARLLSFTLGNTNRERQQLTIETVQHAKLAINSSKRAVKKLLFIAHETYPQGVIGLVAGKLVEEFYRPSIVVSIGEKHSKASARSVTGFNIIEFIRGASDMLVNAGGHPMAAGFTVETKKLLALKEHLEKLAEELITDAQLVRSLRIDCELPFTLIDTNLFADLQKLSPFGMGNTEPTFVSKRVVVDDVRLVGKERRHLKLTVRQDEKVFDAIAFGLGERASELHSGDTIDIVYTIAIDSWNGNEKLQLKVKDIKIN